MSGQTYSDAEISEAAARVFHRMADWDAELQAFWRQHAKRLEDENREDLEILSTALHDLVRLTGDGEHGRGVIQLMRKYLHRAQFGIWKHADSLVSATTGAGLDIRKIPPNVRRIRDSYQEPGPTPDDLQLEANARWLKEQLEANARQLKEQAVP